MKLVNFVLAGCFFLFTTTAIAFAQNYQISFAGAGASTTVDSVKVENLTLCTTVNLSGSDTLHLFGTTVVNELSQIEENSLHIYPNPMNGSCSIDFETTGEYVTSIGLYSVSGKRILLVRELLSKGHHSYILNGLCSGFFILKVESGNDLYTAKIVSSNLSAEQVQIKLAETSSGTDKQISIDDTEKLLNLKNGKSIIGMPYNAGNILKFTGKSGNYRTVYMLIPLQDSTITFNFSGCTDADSNHYAIVQIGTQWWMAENLKTTKYSNGIAMIDGTGAGNTMGDYSTKYFFDYDDNPTNTNIYGKLYTWAAAMNGMMTSNSIPSGVQGACPAGWHVPSDAEWNILGKFLDNSVDTTISGWVGTDVGGKMKVTCTTFWNSPNTGAIDSSGFSALPGGARNPDWSFINIGIGGIWWSCTDDGGGNAWDRCLSYNKNTICRSSNYKPDGFSMRCIKDCTPKSVTASASPTTLCAGETLNLSGSATNATNWNWAGPDGFTSTQQNPTISSITTDGAGIYTLTAINLCGSAAAVTASVTVNTIPTAVSASANPNPICAGNTLTLTGTANNATTWDWTGPNGFISTSQSPLITSIATAGAGIYTLTASNTCGAATAVTTASVTVNSAPAAPVAATHTPSQTQIIWNWAAVIGATGYKWNTANDYGTATDNGASTTKTQTGLICSTTYTLYIWAYNTCGNSTVTTLTQSTSVFTCPATLNVTHTAGTVAPVTKSVTYGVVNTQITGACKCWITQNLGSSHQATSATDTTEASAGWYWQFNRKQGYKHTGTTRTPGTAWNATPDNLSTTWEASKDPCTLLLGASWRIPTFTEWTAAIGAPQNWSNYNDTFASVLKLHCSSHLEADGSLAPRGFNGYFWSSNEYQYHAQMGWHLLINDINSIMGNSGKVNGFSLRCLRD